MAIIFEDNSKLTEAEEQELKKIISELERISGSGQKLSGVALDNIMDKINRIESDLAERFGQMISLEDICAEGETLARLLDDLVSLEEWERITKVGMKEISDLTRANKETVLKIFKESPRKPGKKNYVLYFLWP
jgi:hypothetical protein